MNLLKRELWAGLKPFILWSIGLFVLVFAGMVKFTGVSAGGESVGGIVAQLPRIVQAVMGIVGINIETLSGYYAILSYFAMLCASIYAIYLGSNAVNREAIDKTYEFVFTKPRTRGYILLMKLNAGFTYLFAFSLLNLILSVLAVAALGLEENINGQILLFVLSVFIVSLFFFMLSAMLSAVFKRSEKGVLAANLCFFGTFIIGIIYDMLEDGGVIRILSPFKYFIPQDIIDGRMDIIYIVILIISSVVLCYFTFRVFDRKDLNAA